MSSRLLLISSDAAIVQAVKAGLDAAASLLQMDNLPDDDAPAPEDFQPNEIIIDSDAHSGVQTAFERIASVRRQFPKIPVIALGNEMSAQLVLAALRAGADDFVDRDAGADQMQSAIRACMAQKAPPRSQARSRIAAVLSAMPSEQDQDFALNLAVRAALRPQNNKVLYIDLSLPATQAGIALGLDLKMGVPEAISQIARLDGALLESAVARCPRSGLFVMPLSGDFRQDSAAFDAASFSALLQILQGIFDVIVIGYGPFSRQRALLEMVPSARFFLCCNQRFPSIRGAGDLMQWLSERKSACRPRIVIHEMAPGQTPDPADIRKVLDVAESIDIRSGWDDLADHLNDGTPMALAGSSRYGRSLDLCLAAMGLAPLRKAGLKSRVRSWLSLPPASGIDHAPKAGVP